MNLVDAINAELDRLDKRQDVAISFKTAYNEGYAYSGIIEHNPYDPLTPEHTAWRFGWEESIRYS